MGNTLHNYLKILYNSEATHNVGRRYLFSTNVNDTAEDIIATWENRWDIEVLIRELKILEGFLPNLA
jgi:hypothetical protein